MGDPEEVLWRREREGMRWAAVAHGDMIGQGTKMGATGTVGVSLGERQSCKMGLFCQQG